MRLILFMMIFDRIQHLDSVAIDLNEVDLQGDFFTRIEPVLEHNHLKLTMNVDVFGRFEKSFQEGNAIVDILTLDDDVSYRVTVDIV